MGFKKISGFKKIWGLKNFGVDKKNLGHWQSSGQNQILRLACMYILVVDEIRQLASQLASSTNPLDILPHPYWAVYVRPLFNPIDGFLLGRELIE